MDNQASQPRVRNILYTAIPLGFNHIQIKKSLFRRHSKYFRRLSLEDKDLTKYSKLRRIKRLHSFELVRSTNEDIFNHVYKLLKPYRRDVTITHLEEDLDEFQLDQKPEILHITRLIRDSFKIRCLTILYSTDQDFKIGIGIGFDQDLYQPKLAHFPLTEVANDPKSLFKLNSIKRLLPSLQSIKLDLNKGNNITEENSFAKIAKYQNILTNVTILKFSRIRIEDTSQFLLDNCIRFRCVSVLSLDLSSGPPISSCSELSRSLASLQSLKHLHFSVHDLQDFIKNFTIPSTLSSISLDFRASLVIGTRPNPVSTALHGIRMDDIENPFEKDRDRSKFYAQGEHLSNLKSLTCTTMEGFMTDILCFLSPLVKKLRFLEHFEFECHHRRFNSLKPSSVYIEGSLILNMISHLTSTLKVLIINDQASQRSCPLLVIRRQDIIEFSVLNQLRIGNIYLASEDVPILKDIIQMVVKSPSSSYGSIRLSSISITESEGFGKLLKALESGEIAKSVSVYLNVDLRRSTETIETIMDDLVKFLSRSSDEMKRVSMTILLCQSESSIVKDYMSKLGVQSVLKRLDIRLCGDPRQMSKSIVCEYSKKVLVPKCIRL